MAFKLQSQNSLISSKDLTGLNLLKFEDYNFDYIDSCIGNCKYIFLGESSHGSEEYSKIKYELVKHLFEAKGFKNISFESGMAECYVANRNKNSLDSTELLESSIFAVWHTKTNSSLMNFISKHNLNISGFDFQYSGSKNNDFINLMPNINSEIKMKAKETDSLFLKLVNKTNSYLDTNNRELLNEYKSIRTLSNNIFNELLSRIRTNSIDTINKDYLFLSKIIENKLFFINNYINASKLYALRDSLMAENLLWMIKKIYPTEKVIIWSHNSHIAKSQSLLNKKRYMGDILSKRIGRESYFIGLFAFSGKMLSGGKEIVISKPTEKYLENKLYNKDSWATFYNIKNNKDKWINKKINTYYWGNFTEEIVPSKYYDGIILIKESTIPVFIK